MVRQVNESKSDLPPLNRQQKNTPNCLETNAMKKALKWVAILTALLLLLIVTTIASLYFLIDPNDYKQEISQLVENKTGHRIEIPGQIDLRVSTSLELTFELGSISVASFSPFADTTLFSSEHASVQASLWPLLKDRQIIVNRLMLRDVQLNLIRDKEGLINWAEEPQPGEGKAPSASGTESPGTDLGSIDIGGIDIANINLVFTDQQNGTSLRLQKFNLQAGQIRPEQQFPVSTDFQLTLDREGQAQLSTSVQMDCMLTLLLSKQRYLLEQLALETTVNSDQLPTGTLSFNLAMDSDINLAGQEINLRNLLISQETVQLAGNLVLKNFTAPAVSGHFELKELAPLTYLTGLGLTVPHFADSTALEKLAAELDISYSPDGVAAQNVQLILDDSVAKASFNLVNLKKPEITFKAVIDQLDLDRYQLVKPTTKQSTPPATDPAAQKDAASLPVEALRNLNFTADLSLQKLKVNKLSLANIQLKATGKEGRIRLDPVAADLYNGSVTVNGEIDATGTVPKIKVSKQITGVELGPMVIDLTGRQEISGRADIKADVTTTGLTQMELNRNMNGTMSIKLADGEISRLKILDTIRRAKAIVDKEPLVEAAADQPTGFAALNATGVISNGVFTNNDLLAQSDLMKVTGKGTADLATQKIDYLLTVYLTDRVGRDKDSGLVALGNRAIPYRVKGTFTDLEQSAAIGELIKAEIKNVLMDELQKKLGGKDATPGKGGTPEPTKKDALDPGSLLQKGLKGIFGN